MATKKKLLEAAAGSAGGGAGLDVDEVFNTYIWGGTGSAQQITNNIDLSTEGGLVWLKSRSSAEPNVFVDTERGRTKYLISNGQSAEGTASNIINSFNTDGYTLGTNYWANRLRDPVRYHVGWTWRKAPNFFDIQTWTGDGASNRSISHNLGSTPGMIIVKRLNTTEYWGVWHRDVHDNTSKVLYLNRTDALTTSTHIFGATNPSDTAFYVGNHPVSNNSGDSYVAYIFAHNDGDGGFGPDSDQDIIKCGTYTGGSSNSGQLGDLVDLGFEPQWVMVKNSEATPYGNFGWYIFDSMRGISTTSNDPGKDAFLLANAGDDEDATNDYLNLEANGFRPKGGHATNSHGKQYVYMAIRRGPLAAPEDATDVFDVTTWTSSGEPKFQTSFASDMAMNRNVDSSYDMRIAARLTQGRFLKTSTTDAEASNANFNFDYMDGFLASGGSSSFYSWQWKRAPSFCDVVAYSGNSTAGRTVNHNLGVAPEMMWVKNRDSPVDWWCYHKDLGNTKYVKLNTSDSAFTDSTAWNNTTPTDTVITLGNSGRVNYSNDDYIAYLFASLDGVSKVGSYTGNGTTSNTIDCGFSTGARFIIVKRTDSTGDWWVFDTERGITSSGNDPYLELNTTNAEASYNILNANSSGFEIIQPWSDINASGGSYIFYAIA